MKKWSFEKKKRFVYIVTALLISAIVIVVIANLGILNASATDIEDYPLQYNNIYREYEDFNVSTSESMIVYTKDVNVSINKENNYNGHTKKIYLFIVGNSIFNAENLYIGCHLLNSDGFVRYEIYHYITTSTELGKNMVVCVPLSEEIETEIIQQIQIDFAYRTRNPNADNEPFVFDALQLEKVILTDNYQYGAIRAQEICDKLNGYNNNEGEKEKETETETKTETPLTEVYGTDQFTISSYDIYNTYTIENIVPTSWNDFYAGFIGRVKTADGISVPIYYNWGVDGLQYGDGTITVLDPNYHEYIQEITINGTITNGNMQLDTSTDIEIVYIAISGNYNNLSNHLLQKVNEYQLVADQIQEAYNNGYQNGYTDGVNITQMGAFGDAELIVYFNFVEDATGTYFKQQVNFPFNVNTGGISFDNVWTWYMNSEWNRSGISVYNVEFDIILYDTGVLWSNTMFRFGVAGYEITAQMLPYSVQVSTVEVLENVWDDVNLTNSGKYYYLTNDSLIGYHVDRIRFYINAQDLSYYDQLITNKLTLYNNLGEYTMNVKSFNAGYNNGYDVGYINGEKDGIIQAQELAYNKGHAAGYEEGIDAGYVIGFDEGVGQDFRFYDLFFSMFDAQLNTFRSVVSFEIFGINVAGFILGLITIAIAAFVLKKVW